MLEATHKCCFEAVRSVVEGLEVHGGAGGIGFTTITLAKRFGARVITTVSSPEKAAAVTSWGADVAIDYTKEDFVAPTPAIHSMLVILKAREAV